jgi:hypothetical protein
MTVAAYLSWEREQNERHEYVHGAVFAMFGGSPRHAALIAAMTTELSVAQRGGPCRVLSTSRSSPGNANMRPTSTALTPANRGERRCVSPAAPTAHVQSGQQPRSQEHGAEVEPLHRSAALTRKPMFDHVFAGCFTHPQSASSQNASGLCRSQSHGQIMRSTRHPCAKAPRTREPARRAAPARRRCRRAACADARDHASRSR